MDWVCEISLENLEVFPLSSVPKGNLFNWDMYILLIGVEQSDFIECLLSLFIK